MEFSEDPGERARKYIANFEKAYQKENIRAAKDSVIRGENVTKVSDAIERYLRDAHYYLEHDKPSTSLASVAYAEGLLDALKFLELVQ